MIKLIYSKYGRAISDHNAESFLTCMIECDLKISTENVIHAARTLYREGVIKDLEIYFEADDGLIKLNVDKDGRIDQWPKGFCDTMDKFLERLLT